MIKVQAGREVVKDGKVLFGIQRQGLSPVETDAMTYYIASKLDWAEFEKFAHEYKYNESNEVINGLVA